MKKDELNDMDDEYNKQKPLLKRVLNKKKVSAKEMDRLFNISSTE